MAYTGKNLYDDISVRTYQGGAGAYLNIARANYIVNSAIINLVEADYPNIAVQKNTDEISPCIKTDKLFIPNNKQVLLKPLIITNVSIGANPTITFNRPHNLIANTNITMSGVQGTTQANTTSTTFTTPTPTTIILNGVTTSGTYVVGTGIATSAGYIIDDYSHLLAVQYQYKQTLNVIVKSVLNNTLKTTITINAENNIRTGEQLNFTNFLGANITGDLYVKKVAYNQIELYTNQQLTTPYIVSGTWVLGGTIKRYGYRYADPLNPDQKIDVYPSTAYYPLYQCNDNRVSIEVYNSFNQEDDSIKEIGYNIDYLRTYTPIDVTNNIYDIHQDFNAKFCDRLIEYAALKFQAMTSSGDDVQITEIIGGAKG